MGCPRPGASARLAVALALIQAGCGDASSDAPAERVVLITCDTLRTDRVGVYGNGRGLTPHLDAFARECIVYDAAYSSAPLTAPALAALLTGRLPDEIGVSAGNKVQLPLEVTTLPELLREAGIPTTAVVSNWVLRNQPGAAGAGLAQGFDRYDDEMTGREASRQNVRERVARDTTEAALRWLRERPGDRFFLWVHYQDPHGPYTPPAEHLRRLDRPPGDEAPLAVGETQRGRGELPGYQVLGDARHPDFYRVRYDAEVAYFDQELGRLLEGLAAEGLVEDALILFTADHGESLGEHDYWFSHGQTVFRELVHVPLLVRYPAGAPHPPAEERDGLRRAPQPVGHLDVFPTVLAAFGLPALPSRGRSLLAAEADAGRVLGHTLRSAGAAGRWEGLTDGRYHVVRSPGSVRLYDLREDPGELRDLADQEGGIVRDLSGRYRSEVERLPLLEFEGRSLQLSEEALEELRKLGYAGDE